MNMSRRNRKRTELEMINLARTIALAAVIAYAGTAGAGEAPAPPAISPPGLQADAGKDWSQMRLTPEPALRKQIERTMVFLNEDATGLDDEIFGLKNAGILDRRSMSKIRNALNRARGSMSRVAKGMEADERMDGWTARMIAYELGLAADTLAQQADMIGAKLSSNPSGGDGSPEGESSDAPQPRGLATTLTEGGNLIRETAQAIVRNLR